MGQVIRCIILSLMVGICVKIYFETLLARRKWRHKWVEYTLLPVLTAGFMLIAFTEIPPYFLQPLRLILLLFVTAQIYFQVKPLQNFILSVLFCGVIWIVELVTVSLLYMLPWQDYLLPGLQEEAAYCILLCLVLLLHRRLKGRAYVLENTKWLRFGYFPIISMAAITAVGMISWNGDESQNRIFLIVTAGFGIMNLLAFYFIWEILVKEAKLRRFVIMQEKTRNQMELYRTMQSSFEQQKRFLHDYKKSAGLCPGSAGGWKNGRGQFLYCRACRKPSKKRGLRQYEPSRSQRGTEPQVCGCAGKKRLQLPCRSMIYQGLP